MLGNKRLLTWEELEEVTKFLKPVYGAAWYYKGGFLKGKKALAEKENTATNLELAKKNFHIEQLVLRMKEAAEKMEKYILSKQQDF